MTTENEHASPRGPRYARWRTLIGKAIGWLAGIVVLYGIAGLVGSAVPANRGWSEVSDGIPVWVEDNGVHTGIVLPVIGPAGIEGADWRDLLSPYDIRDPRYAAHSHVAFGWGDREFYVNTPRWRDVSPMTVVRAATGSEHSVMYVERTAEPRPALNTRRVLLRPEEYARLVGFIRSSFDTEPSQFPYSQPGWGNHDSFYTAKGNYSAFDTCNSWTGRALRTAGIRIGYWTPFSVTVMTWL